MSLVGTMFIVGFENNFVAWSAYLFAFSFPTMPMWDGTHMNSMFFLVWIKHVCVFEVISFFELRFFSESRVLKESLIISMSFDSNVFASFTPS